MRGNYIEDEWRWTSLNDFVHTRSDPESWSETESACARYLPDFEHVAEMCFTLSTFKVFCELEEPLALDELVPLLGAVALLEAEGVPVIATSCPTWSLNFEVSP